MQMLSKDTFKTTTLFLALLSFICLTPNISKAQEKAPTCLPSVSGRISYQMAHMKYSESNMDEKGYTNGVYGGITWHSDTLGIMTRLEGEVSIGSLDYTGQTWGGSPANSSGDTELINFRGLLGKDIIFGQKAALTPYFGIGLRYWSDKQKGSGSYKRETVYAYAPLGFEVNYKPQRNFRIVFNAEYDLFIHGANKSHLGDADPGFNTVNLDQDSGYGYRFSLRCIYDTGVLALSAEPFIRYFKIDQSKKEMLTYYGIPTGVQVVEPENETTIYGLRLGVEF